MRRTFGRLAGVVLFCCGPVVTAGVVLQPTPAPEWEVSAWLNGDPGSLGDHRGQVVVIGMVQLACPASREFAIPLFQRWQAIYGDRPDVALVLIHSVFEGSDFQPPERLRMFVNDNGILQPIGVDAYDGNDDPVPRTMRRFEAGGTPHLVIVGRNGMIRFTHFGPFVPGPVEGFFERLLQEPTETIGPMSVSVPHAERAPVPVETRMSGTYQFRTEKATGVCTNWVPAMEVLADLQVDRDAVYIRFVELLLGMPEMDGSYDATTGRVEGEGRRTVASQGGLFENQTIRLEGVLDDKVRPPELEFGLSFLDGKCAVQGRARRLP